MLPAVLFASAALLASAPAALAAPEVRVVAGAPGTAPLADVPDGSAALSAAISPRGLLVTERGRLLFSDACGVVREVADGRLRRVAGVPDCDGTAVLSPPGFGDAADPLRARLGGLVGLGRGGRSGDVVLADTGNHRIRVLGDGVATLAGGGTGIADGGFADGPAATARFDQPAAAEALRDGSVVVADAGNGRVRRIAGGMVTTIAGGGDVPAAAGVPATRAQLGLIADVAVLPGGGVAFTDVLSGIVWRIAHDGTLAAEATGLVLPFGLDARGPELVVAELGAGRVQRIAADGRRSVLTTAIPRPYAVAAGLCPDEVYVDSFAADHQRIYRVGAATGCGAATGRAVPSR
jgi:hypothetical protein